MDTKQQLLDLHKDIYVQTTAGYEARLSQAFVDMGKGTVTSDEHVDVKRTNGTISADRMKITGGGDVVRFDGHVVMHIDKLPPPADAEPAPDFSARASCKIASGREILQREMIP